MRCVKQQKVGMAININSNWCAYLCPDPGVFIKVCRKHIIFNSITVLFIIFNLHVDDLFDLAHASYLVHYLQLKQQQITALYCKQFLQLKL